MVTASTTRFEESDKSEATDLLKSMGLTFNGYLNMAVKQLINQRRIPFEILPAKEEPSEETRRAMIAAEAKESAGGGCSKEPNRLNGVLLVNLSSQLNTVPHHVMLHAPTRMRGSGAAVT